ncbi:hypothetical protein AMTR_s00106p00113020 [Amborella trichopoda]|uniref:Uncharacterized protein n=1 Tax=Amborella trichopoda TaxID=13333 RepID=W1NZL2_AMBTC|nr:hypothetical protein AMTR_s00106p00113020 [Amborella trichopoda]
MWLLWQSANPALLGSSHPPPCPNRTAAPRGVCSAITATAYTATDSIAAAAVHANVVPPSHVPAVSDVLQGPALLSTAQYQ